MMNEADMKLLGRKNYEGYGKQRNWVTWNGLPMPARDDLGDIQEAWIAGARAVCLYIESDGNE